jgi:hypothetical protein
MLNPLALKELMIEGFAAKVNGAVVKCCKTAVAVHPVLAGVR